MKILITGANGFIGSYISSSLESKGFEIIRTCRNLDDSKYISIGEIDSFTDWSKVLVGVDLVIHLAGRAHKPMENSKEENKKFLNTNYYGTINLAKQCVLSGVKNFIFFSSIKVNGEKSKLNQKINEFDKPNPQDIYGKSKLKAEKYLIRFSEKNNLNLKIIRLPLVYGPNVKGNFLNLLKIISKGLPLPFRGLKNKRSMIFIGNLFDFILKLINYKSSKPEIFLVSDGQDINTFELIGSISKIMKISCWQFALPKNILRFIFLIAGRINQFSKISDPLEIDISKSKNILKWQPKYSIYKGLEITCNWYLSRYDKR